LRPSAPPFEAGDEEAHQLDDDFIRALEVGKPQPPLGMGVDAW
jgi:lysyl-tRNA synthetase class II